MIRKRANVILVRFADSRYLQLRFAGAYHGPTNGRQITQQRYHLVSRNEMSLRALPAVLLALVVVVASAPAAAQDSPADTAVIDNFIAAQAAKQMGEEPEGIRKVVTGDLNHDGLVDTAVLYTIEGQNGSNNYIQYLAVFIRTKKGQRYAANQSVGGKNRRAAELVSIIGGLVNLDTLGYGPKDPSCCPTIKGTTRYALTGGALKEKRRGGKRG
jgi:hypothetical protein